ncbi:TIGR01841 family phasin [Corticibacterium sp. UT-5YL-CI-8]|nr:TIGR01841 family phasin [Tianweitania sp. UT-5YL-CI-8]
MSQKSENQSFADIFTRFGKDLNLPRMDIQTVIDHHRKNLEALENSAKAVASGTSSLASRQHEMLKSTLDEVAETAKSFKLPLDPVEAYRRQSDFARKTFEAAIENVEELSTILSKSGSESFDILRQRMDAAMAEFRDGYGKK